MSACFSWIITLLRNHFLSYSNAADQVFTPKFLDDTQPRFHLSTAPLVTYNFVDISSEQTLFELSVICDALAAWGLLMILLKYFHVNVANSVFIRAFSIACDALVNVGLAVVVGSFSFFVLFYFLFAKSSLLSKHPDYSLMKMLRLQDDFFDSMDGFHVAPSTEVCCHKL